MSSASRRKARLVAFKALYAIDVGGQRTEEALESALAEAQLTPDNRIFAEALVRGTMEKRSDIDTRLEGLARDYSLDRMAAIDRTLLRLGAYEILFHEDTPTAVAINEVVSVAKKYSTAESGKFINGILGELDRRKDGPDS
ncbi:MAG: transcription antitermination factor NusB [Armatimonadetes bacterium]|nr:transcription antitermination factor NusB [Armatimonadota bacterium]